MTHAVLLISALGWFPSPAAAVPMTPSVLQDVRPVPTLAVARILVAPFETPRDSRTYWLGEAVAVLIADDINARGLGAITRQTRERAYEQLHLPPNAVLSRATVIRVGQVVGAARMLVGAVQVDGDALTIRARPIQIDVGRGDVEIVERGQLTDLVPIAQRVARRAVPGGDLGSALAPPLQAFEQFIKGLLAEQPASQATFLETALKLDPSYDRARLALWEVRTAQGDHAAALAAVKDVRGESAFARRARFRSAVSLIALRQFDDAYPILKTLEAGGDAAVLNNLGIVQLRRGSTAETGKPAYFFNKAVTAEPDDPDYLFNLGYAYAVDRDPQAAMYWLREAVRRNPADSDAHFVLAEALESAGSTVEAARERELAGQLSARYADTARRGTMDTLPRGLDRVRQDIESRRDVAVEQIVSTTQRDQREMAQFHLDRGQRLFDREQDREAMVELRRAVFLSPYEADAHLLIGRIHLRAGRPREAADALKISIWSRDGAPAHVALAQAYLQLKDTAAARMQVQRALALDPASAEARQLQGKLDHGGSKPQE
jgi:tetratricopeptide (TPR) repeat protein